jgi:hypothetical protein
LLLVLTALLIGLVSFNWGKTSAKPVASTATPVAAPFDWAAVSSRDLKVAKIFITARDAGITAAMDSLDGLASNDSSFIGDAHVIAHGLGRFAIANNRNDPSVLTQCRPTYQAGCYHGVLEGYLTSLPRANVVATTQLCSKLAADPTNRFDALQCAHGLGHGFLETMDYKVADALVACDGFDAKELQGECHDGVFMENTVHGLGMPKMDVTDSLSSAHTHAMAHGVPTLSTFRASDLAFPCDSVGAAYQPACWGYQPLVIARFTSYDFAKILAACALAPAASSPNCYRGVGKQSIGWFGFNLPRVISMCATAGSHEPECVAGGVEVLVDFTMKPDRAIELCRRAREGLRTDCFAHLGKRLARVHSEAPKLATACQVAVAAEFIGACIRGSRQQ